MVVLNFTLFFSPYPRVSFSFVLPESAPFFILFSFPVTSRHLSLPSPYPLTTSFFCFLYYLILYSFMADNITPSQSVEELIAHTETFSCADNRLSLPAESPMTTSCHLTLVGKILSTRNFTHAVVKDIVDKAWKPSSPIQVQRVERNIFLFSFGHEVDRELAFNKRPWTIKGAHLVLETWSPELTWKEINFTSSSFWVQVHGLPILWQRKDYLNRIGLKIGNIIEVDLVGDSLSHWKRFVRLRIDIDVTVPLLTGLFLPRPNLSDVWVGLKYEKLLQLCYRCGILGHAEKDCNVPKLLLSNQYGTKFPAFGDWVRSEYATEPPDIYIKMKVSAPIHLISLQDNDVVQPMSCMATSSTASGATQTRLGEDVTI